MKLLSIAALSACFFVSVAQAATTVAEAKAHLRSMRTTMPTASYVQQLTAYEHQFGPQHFTRARHVLAKSIAVATNAPTGQRQAAQLRPVRAQTCRRLFSPAQ